MDSRELPKGMFEPTPPEEVKRQNEQEVILVARKLVNALMNERGPRLCGLRVRELAVSVFELDGNIMGMPRPGLPMHKAWSVANTVKDGLRHLIKTHWRDSGTRAVAIGSTSGKTGETTDAKNSSID